MAKQFHGDLERSSAGEMTSVEGTVEGSSAYVAIERVTGTLHGRNGSFALVHSGTMRRGGEFSMIIRIVPDSGTGELAGLDRHHGDRAGGTQSFLPSRLRPSGAVNAGYCLRSTISSVDVADAYNRPSSSTSVPSVNAARLPKETILPMARSRPVSRMMALW